MESLIDVVTTSFEAILGACVVFAAGYAYNTKQDKGVGQVSSRLQGAQFILLI